ncbi:hypothetical protein WQE_08567 [Paraburkholderia hospita]|uniref:Uncharacterized protein n=1 Tax=Paraburkholderia hospita TaxID=169430 RepID=A0ABN0FRV2_9BURK|nr:hypothetical protein WQE_08567 [Paraburkholderia hospita]OUL70258.1 hypothetical protein CA602_48315 [Paraburkholderia hospita]
MSIHAADVAAERMEYDEYQSERMIALGFPVYGCCNGQTLVATPVDALDDGGGQLQVVNSSD